MERESVELAEGLNSLYSLIKQGGDFAFVTEDSKILEFKKTLEQKYNKLNIELLSFLVEFLNKNPEADFVFVPSESGIGVAVQYSYQVNGRVEFDANGKVTQKKEALGNNEPNR